MTKSKYGYKLEKEENGYFKKVYTPFNKGLIRENNPLFKGGSHRLAREICIENEKDLTCCEVEDCKIKKKIVVHHKDGNKSNNKIENLMVLCSKHHDTIHNNGLKTRFQVGHQHNKETLIKISNSLKGHPVWNKGLEGYHYNNGGIVWQ